MLPNRTAEKAKTMSKQYTIGLDFGTNSMRALVVDVSSGRELAEAVVNYPSGEKGIVLDDSNPDLARQQPLDYLKVIETAVPQALAAARKGDAAFDANQVIGLGVDTTGSTPMPVDAEGNALTTHAKFANTPAAMAWLWKDHTGHAEAAEWTKAAEKLKPEYLAKCGGRYSSEWFWSKILKCARVAPEVFDAAYTWVEIADWIPAVLCGTQHPSKMVRGICAAGHKAFFNPTWGGYPSSDFVATLDKRLERVRESLPDTCANVADAAGTLSDEWSKKLGLPAGIPVAVGAFDAHLGAVGAGIADGTLVKIMGTSTCDIMTSKMGQKLADIPGLCGIVPESVVPGAYGLEAGQSAVGDLFAWLVDRIKPANQTHESLTKASEQMKPGESGLLALDWHNGNRTVLVDQRLTGTFVGMNLHTTPAEMYRALIEATAFGSRVIMERFEQYGVKVNRVVNCGGISARNPMAMQIYADIMNRPIAISRSLQTCALGSAIAAAVVAKAHPDFDTAVKKMTGVQDKIYQPIPENVATYEKLFKLYMQLHDAFGIAGTKSDISNVMKDLLTIRDAALAE
jgi:L-ribulokinase